MPLPKKTVDLVGRKVAVSAMFDTVTIEIICGDDYEAAVLYDDVVERLTAGEGITLTVTRPSKVEG